MAMEFYRELPEGYRADKIVDAKNKKLGVIMNLAALALTVAVYVVTDLISSGRITLSRAFDFSYEGDGFWDIYFHTTLLPLIIFLASMAVYLVLHELTHGAAYKILTHEKLTFGMTWSAAYCGVPQLYVGKKVALIALLSPFVLFNVVFIVAIAIAGETAVGTLFRVLFAMHFGGCVGDLYDTLLLIFRYPHGCLINDNGPKQVFYVRGDEGGRK